MPRKQKWRLSHSACKTFKNCPMAFRLAYVEGLRRAEDTESQRMGTNWHECQRIASMKVDDPCICIDIRKGPLADPYCSLCVGSGSIAEADPLTRVTAWLDARYCDAPAGVEIENWEIEKTILAYSMAGWLWYYTGSPLVTINSELAFSLPIRNPATGRALPSVTWQGKIDKIIELYGHRAVLEHKSTSKPIDSGAVYWDKVMLDSQGTGYLSAGRQLQIDNLSGVLYDVWHRPAIRPKKLSQADTKRFVETGDYCGQEFDVTLSTDGEILAFYVNARELEITWGAEPKATKKNPNPDRPFAVRETPEMFGARLLQDITEDPGKHFVRREIPKTDAEIEQFEWQLYHIYQSMRAMDKAGHWFTNEDQCENMYRCPYIGICAHNVDVFDGETTPDGFRRIFKTSLERGMEQAAAGETADTPDIAADLAAQETA